VPLINDVPVTINGVRVQIRDALAWSKGRLLLATNQGLCLYDLRWGNCQALSPSGLDDEVGIIMRDRAKPGLAGGRVSGCWKRQCGAAASPGRAGLGRSRRGGHAEAPDGRLASGWWVVGR